MRSHRPSPALLAGALLLACTEATPPPQTAAPRPTASASVPAPRRCAFQGVVSSEGGAAVAGALVAAIPPGADVPVAVARTEGDGRYCFETLEAARLRFAITAPRHTAAYVDVRDVEPAAPGAPPTERSTLDVQLGGPGFLLYGQVTDDAGVALGSVRVLLPRMDGSATDLFVTEADARGRYQIKLPAGVYQPRVGAERYRSRGTELRLDHDQGLDLRAQRVNPKEQPAPDEVVAWIKEKAVKLRTAEPGSGLDDLEPLGALFGDARVVALGDATQGAHEVFQLRHRILEFLVEKLGFRAFALEAGFGDLMPLSDYVRTGRGDPKAALANQGSWTWDTEEVLALVEWMRRYNADRSHKEKLSLWGAAASAASSVQALLTFLAKVDPALGKEVAPALEILDEDFTAREVGSQPPGVRKGAADAVKRILAALDARRDEYIQSANERALRIARIHARVLGDFLLSAAGDESAQDRAMADVVADLLELEGAGSKLALLAHNARAGEGNERSMGALLAKRLGAAYFSAGVKLDEGSFQAVDGGPERRGLVPFTVPSAPAGSLDHTLSRAGLPLLALGLRGAPRGGVSDWLSAVTFSRQIGTVFSDPPPASAGIWEVVPEQWDALFFVQKTTAARPTATGKRAVPDSDRAPPPAALADPGFEAEKKLARQPAGWSLVSAPAQLVHRARLTNRKCAAGKRCVVVTREKSDIPTGLGSFTTAVDAAPYRGKKVRVAAAVRFEGKTSADEAFLTASAVPAQAKPTSRPRTVWAQVPGTAWKRVSVELDVPEDAARLVLGLAVTGAATAAIDDILVGLPGAEETESPYP